MKLFILTMSYVLSISCNSLDREVNAQSDKIQDQENNIQIGEYVVKTFEDSKGNLWFGTLERGVAKFDGTSLRYFTTKDGLPSDRVVDILEDDMGNLWFGTGSGLSKFDGKSFTNFSEEDGLCSNMISILFTDSRDNFWIGTWGGVCRFDGSIFEELMLPYPVVDPLPNKDTKDWTTAIFEDAKGNIWFGRDGFGACRYDGRDFVHFTRNDGLLSNNVQAISEDSQGNIWIGTRVAERDNADINKRTGQGGLHKYDGEEFSYFPDIPGLSENDVYTIYKDAKGNLWISTTSFGVYSYDGSEFKNYAVSNSTMCMTDDRNGNLWLGCAGGLWRINSGGITNVTMEGPWD